MQDAQSPRFRFKDAVPGISGYERLSGPLDWLESAGLLIRTFIVEFPAIPLSSQVLENRFKLYFHDTGMLGSIGAIAPEAVNTYGFGSYQGYVAENVVAQELTAAGHRPRSRNNMLFKLDGNPAPLYASNSLLMHYS
jgi:predicted AAA+ superfamily ATPase